MQWHKARARGNTGVHAFHVHASFTRAFQEHKTSIHFFSLTKNLQFIQQLPRSDNILTIMNFSLHASYQQLSTKLDALTKKNCAYLKCGYVCIARKEQCWNVLPLHFGHKNLYKTRMVNVIICYHCSCHNIFTWNEFFLDMLFSRTLHDPQPGKNALFKLTNRAYFSEDDSCTAVIVDGELNNLAFFLLLFLIFPSAPALLGTWRRGSSFPLWRHLQWTYM